MKLLTGTDRSDRLIHDTQSILSRISKRLRFGLGAVMTNSWNLEFDAGRTPVHAGGDGFEWGFGTREVAFEI
jgi:hypothetical protein